MNCDIIILGAGPAGLTAALYAKRYGLTPVVLERSIYGGQVVNTPEVENYTGIKSIGGAELAMAMFEQVNDLGVEVRLEAPTAYHLAGEEKWVETAGGRLTAPAVILANGAKRRLLGCPGEQRLSGKGVSYCATCDGAFYRGRQVAIVGGGNTALEDALFLANLCERVHLVHRRDEFRGNKILSDALTARQNITVHYDSTVSEISGQAKVEAIALKHLKTGEATTLPVSGVFVAIGLEPDNAVFGGQLALNDAGYIVAGEDCHTNLPGVYAAGDTRTKTLRQIVTAAADGAQAAFAASNYLNERAK
ncbi:MAG: thioredoxin-disulfide reductase [Angelakisella sp.]